MTAALRIILPLVVALLLSSCGLVDRASSDAAPAAAETTSSTPAFESQFTRDGTFQSHIEIGDLDFVYTLWPTKSTPRTNEWYPGGDKFFSFTLQAYDLSRDFRDQFSSKRKVWLEDISVSSATTLSGSGSAEEPYRLDEEASRITFDPEPTDSKYGMLITSPKGAFELRNQRIGALAADTVGVTLTFEATVWIQTKAGSRDYEPEVIRQEVPIAIFASDTPTKAQEIPANAN